MREFQETTLLDDDGNDHKYTCVPHPGRQGFKLATKILKFIGPGLAPVIEAVGSGGLKNVSEADIDIAKAIKELMGNLTDIPGLVEELLKYTTRDGEKLERPDVFDIAYQGNYGELVEAIYWVFQVNRFLGFLSRITA